MIHGASQERCQHYAMGYWHKHPLILQVSAETLLSTPEQSTRLLWFLCSVFSWKQNLPFIVNNGWLRNSCSTQKQTKLDWATASHLNVTDLPVCIRGKVMLNIVLIIHFQAFTYQAKADFKRGLAWCLSLSQSPTSYRITRNLAVLNILLFSLAACSQS